MPRYSALEMEKLSQLKEKLGTKLSEAPQFPEVIGDRKLLRFLRGHDFDVEKVTGLVSKFLDWRRDNNVDEIRQNIVLGGRK